MMPVLFVSAALAGAVPVPTGAADGAFKARRVAMLIGVQDYADPALQGLQYAEKDARDLGAVLGSPDVGGFDRVFVISGRAATSREQLLRSIQVATADLQRDDTFLLYLSGHGTLAIDPVEGRQLYFLPSDGKLDAPHTTGLAVADVEAMLHALPARRRALILDTCHNGRSGSRSALSTPTQQLLSGFRGEPPAPRAGLDVSESEARLYAAQYWQPAMEDRTLENGVYTHFLIDALTTSRNASDLDGDGLVDVMEAHQHARDATMAWTGGLQIPRAEYRIVGREEIFLSGARSLRASAERALLAAVDSVLSRARLFVNGTARGELPGLYAVEPGVQDLEVQTADGRTLVKQRVRVQAGETYPLEALLRRRQSTLGLLVGGGAHLGNDALLPFGGGAAVVWANPVRLDGPWRTEAHLSADFGAGIAPGESVEQTSGTIGLGIGIGPTFGPGWVAVTADIRDNWRTSEFGAQADLGGAAGLAIGLDLPVSERLSVSTRVEGWGGLEPVYGELAPSFGGALRVGLASSLR